VRSPDGTTTTRIVSNQGAHGIAGADATPVILTRHVRGRDARRGLALCARSMRRPRPAPDFCFCAQELSTRAHAFNGKRKVRPVVAGQVLRPKAGGWQDDPCIGTRAALHRCAPGPAIGDFRGSDRLCRGQRRADEFLCLPYYCFASTAPVASVPTGRSLTAAGITNVTERRLAESPASARARRSRA
jgi:hypothetical protein